MENWEWPQWLVIVLWSIRFLINLMQDMGVIPFPTRTRGYCAVGIVVTIATSAFVLTKGGFF